MQIRELTPDDIPVIVATNGGAAWHGRIEKWNRRWHEQQHGSRVVMLAVEESNVLGYGSLLWNSEYLPFRTASMPEINDLVVAEAHRRRGVGRQLISALENKAWTAGYQQVGIGVGLYSDYGPAQRLYVRLGYVPDGRGVTYQNVAIPGGAHVRVDDELVLWLTKRLSPS